MNRQINIILIDRLLSIHLGSKSQFLLKFKVLLIFLHGILMFTYIARLRAVYMVKTAIMIFSAGLFVI